MCSYNDERLDSVPDEGSINFTLTMSKYVRNTSHQVREKAIELFFRQINMNNVDLKHLLKSMENWKYFPSPDDVESGIAKDARANMLDTNLMILIPLMKLKPDLSLELIKKTFRINIREKIPCSRMKSPLSLLSDGNLTSFLKPFLDHLMLDCILISDYKQFPFPLFADSWPDFLRENEEVLVPLLIWCYDCDENVIKELCEALKKKERDLFRDNFVSLAPLYIPFYKTDKKADILDKKTLKVLEVERLNKLVNDHFPEIFGRVLKQIEDNKHLKEIFGLEYDHGKVNMVYPTLNYKRFGEFMKEMYKLVDENQSKCFWTTLSSLNPDTLQRLYSEVCRPLLRPKLELESGMISLHGVFILLNMLIKELQENSRKLSEKLPYISWFVINALIHVLNTSTKAQEKLAKMALRILPQVIEIQASIDNDWTREENIMCKLILPLTNILIKKYQECENDTLRREIIKVLNMIVLENKDKLLRNNFIRLIGPFPKQSNDFQELKLATNGDINLVMDKEETVNLEKNLNDELTDFVLRTQHSKEHLESLFQKLKCSTIELKNLIETIPDFQFSEDANQHILHKTMKTLLCLSQNENASPDVKYLSNQCLGYFGPLDLNTIGLKLDEEIDANEGLIRILLQNVIDENHEYSETAIYGLKRVLASSIDKKSIPKELKAFLQPFEKALSQSAAPKNAMKITKENINETVQNIDWWPKPDDDYKTWISNIVIKLLRCYPVVKDGYFSKASMFGHHLVPLAKKSSDFCAEIYPWLMHDILKTCENSDISTHICAFFEQFYREKKIKDQKCLLIMLQMISYLRCQRRGYPTKWPDNFWIDKANYLHLAFAAHFCKQFVSCTVFCDVWCQQQLLEHHEPLVSETRPNEFGSMTARKGDARRYKAI